jgi:poly(A) polymerase
MKISGEWIERKATQDTLALLTEAGHEAYLVGGCVRNSLLGAPVNDVDIATDALPERVIALADAEGLKAIPTGIEHGTVTVVADHIPHEITTYRQDVQSDGRRAVVRFSTDIAEDARRRDFTMNALYATSRGEVVDPLNGLADLKARHVRFIEDPAERIREDYLRILRFFRFHAWYGDPDRGMDEAALGAIATHLKGLEQLSRERVGAEMRKLLSADDPAPAVAAMRAAGVLRAVLPGADDGALAVLVHLETDWAAHPDPMRRLALLGGEDAGGRLRLSKSDIKRLALFRDELARATPPIELGYRFGLEAGASILLLRAALMETEIPQDAREALAKGVHAQFPLEAKDLMPAFTGPALGAQLHALEAAWLRADCALTRAQLLELSADDG